MFYFSHLLRDEEMKEVIQETGMGVESIEFSIAENLDNFSKTLLSYKKDWEKWAVKSFCFTVLFWT